jgi:DNA-binding transcriptional MerR regulator
MTSQDEPLFNIGAVSRMTEISETTLRVWERRYDFPKSARTAGGHRLYSQQEVARLQWVRQRIDEGMQTSQAIRALQHAEREGAGAHAESVSELVRRESSVDSLEILHQRLLASLLAHNEDAAGQVMNDALILYPIEQLIFDVISPTLNDIGVAWSEGRIGVATEHYATHYLRNHLLTWMRTSPPSYRVRPVVLACAPGELHEGSLLMLGVLLRRLRWHIIYLGQTVPLTELSNFVEGVDAAMIVFVAMTEETAQTLADWIHWLPNAALNNSPIIGYGGRVFTDHPEWVANVPGVFLGKTLQEGITRLDRMLHELNPLLH